MVALYDYEAAGADELNLVEGERLTLSSVGMNAGDGWAEVSISLLVFLLVGKFSNCLVFILKRLSKMAGKDWYLRLMYVLLL